MKNDIFNKIFLIIINITFLILNFFVGPNIKEPLFPLFLITNLITVLYFIICLKKKIKIRFIDNKIDIFVIIFLLTSFIPTIFNTYVSLSSQYNCIVQNINVLSIYFLIKNLIKSKKHKNILINILIFSTIPIIIIGFDRLYTNSLWEIINKLDIFQISYAIEDRLIANFNYPNSLGIYLSSILILCLGQSIEKKESKLNTIYKIYSFILILMIVLTKSRGTLILLITFLIIYLVLLKNKDNIIHIITTILISSLGLFIFFLSSKVFISTIILKIFALILTVVLVGALNLFSGILYNALKKINFKYFMYIVGSILIVIITYLAYALNFSNPINIEEYQRFELKNLKEKETYKIKIDVSTIINRNKEENFIIEIVEADNNRYQTKLKIDIFKEHNGIREYEIKPSDDMEYLILRIRNYEKANVLTINKIFVEDEEYIVNYKYIPNSVAEIFTTINKNENNVRYRLDYYKDSLKIIKNNIIFGNGADSWKYLYKSIQSYNYGSKESHSFILDVFMNFGLIGFISLISLIISLIYFSIKILKNNKDTILNTSITISLFLLFIHSSIDFDMSYYLIKVYFFILILLLSTNIKKDNKINNKFTSYIVIIILFITSLFNTCNSLIQFKLTNLIEKGGTLTSKYNSYKYHIVMYPTSNILRYNKILHTSDYISIEPNVAKENLNIETYIDEIITFINDEPYYNQTALISFASNLIIEEIKNGNIYEKGIEKLYYILENYSIEKKYNIKEIIKRTSSLISLYKTYKEYNTIYNNTFLEEHMKKIETLILKEYKVNINNISNIKKTGYEKIDYESFYKQYNDTVNRWIKTNEVRD